MRRPVVSVWVAHVLGCQERGRSRRQRRGPQVYPLETWICPSAKNQSLCAFDPPSLSRCRRRRRATWSDVKTGGPKGPFGDWVGG